MKSKTKSDIQNAAASAKSVIIERANVMTVYLEIAGRAPLIQNNFSQKALEQMLRKHMGLSVQREKKVPREVIEQAMIRNTDGRICEPPTAPKKAILTAAGSIKGVKPWQLRTQLFVEGNSIPITYEKMVPRMDMVRTSGMARAPDVRFRPSFDGWKARLGIQYADTVAVQSVVDLLDRAGNVGIGEWRPEKHGTFGTFRVVRNITEKAEIEEVVRECMSPLVSLRIPEWALDAELDPELLKRVFTEQSDSEEDGDESSDLEKAVG